MGEYSEDDFATQRSSHYNGISPMLAQPDDDDDQFGHFNGLDPDPDRNKLDLGLGDLVVDDLEEPGSSYMGNGLMGDLEMNFGVACDRDDFNRSDHELNASDTNPSTEKHSSSSEKLSSTYESIDSSMVTLPAKPSNDYSFTSKAEVEPASMVPSDYLAVPEDSYIDTGESLLPGDEFGLHEFTEAAVSTSEATFRTGVATSEVSAVTAVTETSISTAIASASVIQTTSTTSTAIDETPTSSSAFPESAGPSGSTTTAEPSASTETAKPSVSTETAVEPEQPPRIATPTSLLPDGTRKTVLEPGPNDDRTAWNAKILSKMIQPSLRVAPLNPAIYKRLKEARQLPEQIRKDAEKRKKKAEKKDRQVAGQKHGHQFSPSPEKSKKRRNMIICIVCNEGVNPSNSGLVSDSLYCSLECIKNMVERCRPCCQPNENITFTNAANELAQLPKKTIVTISTLGVFLQAKPMLKPFVNFAKLQESSKSNAAPIKAEKDLKDEDRIRNSVRVNIREQLMNRAKSLKIGVSRIAVTKLSEQIEVELYRVHKYAKAKRYKEWVQDFFAQILKDDNMFFKKVVTNGYTAQKLVLMKKDEMYISPDTDTTPAKPIVSAPKVQLAKRRMPIKPMLSAVDKILGEEGADTTLKHNSHEYDSNCQICARNTAMRRAALEQAEKDREEEMEERKRRKLQKEKEREERAHRPRFEPPVHHARKVEEDFDMYDDYGGNDDFRPISPTRATGGQSSSSRWNRDFDDFKPVSPSRPSGSRWDRDRDRDHSRGFDSRRRDESPWGRTKVEPSYDRGYSLSPGSPPPPQPPMNRPRSPREMTPPPGVSPDRLAVKHVSQREPSPDFSRDISPDPYGRRGLPPRGGPPRPLPSDGPYFGVPRPGREPQWTPGMPEPHSMNGRPYDDRLPPPGPSHTLESWRREEQWRRDTGGRGTPPFRPDYFADGPPHSYYNMRPGHPSAAYARPVSPIILRPSPPPMGIHGEPRPYDFDHRPGAPPHGHPMYATAGPHPMERRGPPGAPWPEMRRGPTPEFVLEPPVERHPSMTHTPKEEVHVPPVWRQDPTIFGGTVSGLTFNFRCTMRAVSNPAAFELRDRFPNPLMLKARIRPDPMWAFLKSVKNIRRFQIIIATLHIALPEDTDAYYECFDNLKRTSRYAVFDVPAELGIKEAYLFYLDAGEPLPPILLPVDGPGLPSSPATKGFLCVAIVKYAEVKPAIAAAVSAGASPATSMKSNGTPRPTANNNAENQEVEYQTLEEVLVAIENIHNPDLLIKVVKSFIGRSNLTAEEKKILQTKVQAKIAEHCRYNNLANATAPPPPPPPTQSTAPPPPPPPPAEPPVDGQPASAVAATPMEFEEGISSVAAMSSGSVKGESETISASHTMTDLTSVILPPPEAPPAGSKSDKSEPEEGEMRDDDAMDISDGEITSPAPMDFILPPPPPPPSSEALAPPPPPPPPLPPQQVPPFGYEDEQSAPCSGMFNPINPPRPAFPPPRPSMGFFNNDAPLLLADSDGPARGRGRGRGAIRGRGRGLPPMGPRGPGPMPFPNRFPPPPGWQGPPGPGILPPQEDAFMFHGGLPPRGPIPLSSLAPRAPRPPRAFRGGRGRGRGGGPPRPHF